MNSILGATASALLIEGNPDVRMTIWNILIGLLIILILFFILTRMGREMRPEKPRLIPKSIFAGIFLVLILGAGYYLIFSPEKNPNNFASTFSDNLSGTEFPLVPASGPETAFQSVIMSVESLYDTPFDELITFSLLAAIIFLVIAAFKNISVRKRIERDLVDEKTTAKKVYQDLQIQAEKLAEAKAKDEALLESIGEGLIAVDNDGKIMFINKIAIDLLGWEMDELLGKVITGLPLEDERGNPIPFERRPTTLALATGRITKVSYFFVKKDKSRFPLAITATPIKLRGSTTGLIEIIRDITKEKEIDRAKTEFVSLASHQLRTPLTIISWYTEMLLSGDIGPVTDEQKKYLEEIYNGDQRMVELVDTLLDVSRLELGTFTVDPKPTNIVELAESVLSEQELKIKKKNITIVKDFSKNVESLLTDPKLLRMIFQNLITNSLEYTPAEGKIELSISLKDAQTISIQVSDTGYGIPKDQQNQIFNKLFRADNVREKDTDGTGLGLYIVKSIVENSGGKIWFESEENLGTTFFVELPFVSRENDAGKA